MRRLMLPMLPFVLAACEPATVELTDAERAAIADQVNARHAEMWDAFRAADFDRGVSYFHRADLVYAYEGVILDYEAMDQLWRPAFASITSQTVTFADSRTDVFAPGVVSITSSGTYAVTDTLGVTGPQAQFAVTEVWMRRDGEWKLQFVHESTPTEMLSQCDLLP